METEKLGQQIRAEHGLGLGASLLTLARSDNKLMSGEKIGKQDT